MTVERKAEWTRSKKRAHGHASDLPERTPRHPSLHLTAPYVILPLSCGKTLQPSYVVMLRMTVIAESCRILDMLLSRAALAS